MDDPHGLLPFVASAEQNRFFDPDNPNAMIDLHAYADRARATAEALALAVGERYDEFAQGIIGPLMALDLEHASGMLADWNLLGEYWSNLLSSDPLPYREIVARVAAERGRDEFEPPPGIHVPEGMAAVPVEQITEWAGQLVDEASQMAVSKKAPDFVELSAKVALPSVCGRDRPHTFAAPTNLLGYNLFLLGYWCRAAEMQAVAADEVAADVAGYLRVAHDRGLWGEDWFVTLGGASHALAGLVEGAEDLAEAFRSALPQDMGEDFRHCYAAAAIAGMVDAINHSTLAPRTRSRRRSCAAAGRSVIGCGGVGFPLPAEKVTFQIWELDRAGLRHLQWSRRSLARGLDSVVDLPVCIQSFGSKTPALSGGGMPTTFGARSICVSAAGETRWAMHPFVAGRIGMDRGNQRRAARSASGSHGPWRLSARPTSGVGRRLGNRLAGG